MAKGAKRLVALLLVVALAAAGACGGSSKSAASGGCDRAADLAAVNRSDNAVMGRAADMFVTGSKVLVTVAVQKEIGLVRRDAACIGKPAARRILTADFAAWRQYPAIRSMYVLALARVG